MEERPASGQRRVAVIGMGGTIASGPAPGGGVAPALGVEELLGRLRPPAAVSHVDLSREPSSDLGLADLIGLAGAVGAAAVAGAHGVVVTHGTDTIEETAFAVDLLVGATLPVVVTGALRHPGLPGADGDANLLAAIAAAAEPDAAGLGTMVVLNDEIHSARWVRKAHTASPGAFVSRPAGPIGWLAEGRPRFAATPKPLPRPEWLRRLLPALSWQAILERPPRRAGELVAGPVSWPRVPVVTAAVGDEGTLLALASSAPCDGLVIEGTGGGHVPSAWVDILGELAARCPVLLASRTRCGEMLGSTYGFPGSERDLLARGVRGTGALGAFKARLALSLALVAGVPAGEACAFVEMLGKP